MDAPARSSTLRQFRHRVGPWLDRVVGMFGEATTQVYPLEYVGTVPQSLGGLEADLVDAGFTWDPVSMYHYTAAGTQTDGSWVYRPSPLADRQIHVVLFSEDPDRTEVYAHDEFNWRRHPLKHAKELDIRRRQGVREVHRWLDRHDIEHDRGSVVRRWLGHAVEQLRDRFSSIPVLYDAYRL